jgi:hypothetical protein
MYIDKAKKPIPLSLPLYLDIIVDVAIFSQKADGSKIKSQ